MSPGDRQALLYEGSCADDACRACEKVGRQFVPLLMLREHSRQKFVVQRDHECCLRQKSYKRLLCSDVRVNTKFNLPLSLPATLPASTKNRHAFLAHNRGKLSIHTHTAKEDTELPSDHFVHLNPRTATFIPFRFSTYALARTNELHQAIVVPV